MKKLIAMLLVLALMLTSLSALAAVTGGQGDSVARNGELAAFMDDKGYIYISGLGKPVNTTVADSILTIDPYRIVFFAQENALTGIPENRLISLDLESFTETIVTDDAYAAWAEGDSVHYISASKRSNLKEYNLNTGRSKTAFSSFEALERVYRSGAGLVVTLVEGAGAYIQDSVTGSFLPYNGDIAAEIADYEGFEVYKTDSNSLFVLRDGSSAAALVDSSVQDWAVIGSTIYYLSGSTLNMTLKSYDVTNNLWNVILTPSADMECQLTASENALFMLSQAGVVYSVDVQRGRLVQFTTLPALSSYALGGGKSLDGYRIEAVSGQLNVYGVISDSSVLPTFSFVDFSTQIVEDSSNELMLLSAYAISGESTVWDLLQPAEQYTTLRRGSRGDAVAAIQEPLKELDYYDYIVDGIFGWRTEQAIRLLQADLYLEVNGVADAELQRRILSGSLDAYDPYRELVRGDTGYRVQSMQERLRDLGYLADDADGVYGSRTEEAVALFQSENKLRETGTANASTLRKLFSDSADSCSSYIDLQRGDTGYRVRELNKRLKKLYYLEGDAGSSYNSRTVDAVERFQEEYGLTQNGRASEKVQKYLFSRNAPEYSGYITLQRGDDNDRVQEMQQRLYKLDYFNEKCDGYFDKATAEAVKLFQRAVDLKADGVADPDTLEALFASDAPEYREPELIGYPVIELNAWSAYEDGIYYISDGVTTDGGVTVSWFADGDVASYDISITDDRGNIYLDYQGVSPSQTIASIPVTSLDDERTYTISVVAHPVDEDDDPTLSRLRFVRILEEPEPEQGEIGVIGKLILTPVGSDITISGGVYQMPGNELSFVWSADGAVAGYTYAVSNVEGEDLYVEEAITGTRELTLHADALDEEGVYTLTVNAIPVNGTLADATTETIAFTRVALAPTMEPTVAPTDEPTDAPTAEPTIEPTVEPTAEPTVEPTAEPVVIGRPQLAVSPYVATSVADADLGGGMIESVMFFDVAEGDIELSWPAEHADTYFVQIFDGMGGLILEQEMNSTNAGMSTKALREGEAYLLKVEAFRAEDSSVRESAVCLFRLPAQEEPEIEPTEEPEVEPTEEPEVEPTEEPEVEPTEEPVVVGLPQLIVEPFGNSYPMDVEMDGMLQTVSVFEVVQGDLSLRWPAENADNYSVQILDESGFRLVDQQMASTAAAISSSILVPGDYYTLKVTAFNTAEEAASETAVCLFLLPVQEEAAAESAAEEDYAEEDYAEEEYDEEAYTEEEYSEEEYVEEEYTEEYYEEEYAEEEYTGEEYTGEEYSEEEYAEEEYVEEAYAEEEYYEEEYTEEEYTEEEYEDTSDTYPMDDPSAWMEPIDSDADPNALRVIQLRLVEWLWLEEESYEEGELDEITVQAIIAFQTLCAEYGMELIPCFPEEPVIEPDTLWLLFNADGTEILNPYI